jgi:hypothetical protein
MTRPRVDNNQQEIIDALRAVGATVQPLNAVKCGCPDLLVGYRGKNYLMEVKTERGILTNFEIEWIDTWKADVWIVRNPEQALRVIGIES